MNREQTPATSIALDLTECDRERIHEISMVQGHGGFVSFVYPELRVKNVCANLGAVMGTKELSEAAGVGARLDSLLDADLVAEIIQRVGTPARSGIRTYFKYWGRRKLDVFLYSMEDGVIAAELSPLPDDSRSLESSAFDDFVRSARTSSTVALLSQRACEAVRRLTGLERVMVYRFYPPSWYGVVIAEDRVAASHSFRDHRFPASDIPKPARELYLRNQVRFIYDSAGEDTPILPLPGGPKPRIVDLSDSRLRSVSRIHLEYLKNMGVSTSFSVAITVDGKLWGLIACHGTKPRYITHAVRAVCESVANTLALFLPVLEANIKQLSEIGFSEKLQAIFADLRMSADPRERLLRNAEPVLSLFSAGGIALVEGAQVDFSGVTPRRADVAEISLHLRQRMEAEGREVLALESLTEISPDWESVKDQASGVLAVLAPELGNALLLLFRPEQLHTVQWGGDPHKAVESRNYQGRINPRASFETWTETIRGRSAPWQAHEISGALHFRNMIFDALIRQGRLINELGELRKG